MGIIIKDELGPGSSLTLTCSGASYKFRGDGDEWVPSADELRYIFEDNPAGPGVLFFSDAVGAPDAITVKNNNAYILALQVRELTEEEKNKT